MYQSKEIRWFERTPDTSILQWFRGQQLSFDQTKPSVDFYLPVPGNFATGIKLREGNVEIKTRITRPEHLMLTDHVSGFTERWNKWSFVSEKSDPLTNEIINEKKYNWIEVYKERIGVKIVQGESQPEIKKISDKFPAGCQVEYTRLIVHGKLWYSFAIEWFGVPGFDPGESFFKQMLGETILHAENSMGYPEMLHKMQ